VHDAWVRLGGARQWNGPEHFLAVAAETMRRILIDRARRKQAIRHGGGWERASLSGIQDAAATDTDDEILAVHEALDRLAAVDARKAELVKLRYFVGLSLEEAAATLGVSVPTAKRDWAFARAWLFREIRRPAS
jgi:RNA polymerase sigma factor (TIGR02999 family)